jgi:hypothetical protein
MKAPKITLDTLFKEYHELLDSHPMNEVAMYVPEATFEAIREAMRRPKMEDRELLKLLEEQIKEDCSDFIFYDMDTPSRQGPVVTVYLAELIPELGGVFARAVAVCSNRDTPSRLKGRIAAAKRLLRAIKNGIATIRPAHENFDVILELERKGLLHTEEHNGKIVWVAGDCGVDVTQDERISWEARKAFKANKQGAKCEDTKGSPAL